MVYEQPTKILNKEVTGLKLYLKENNSGGKEYGELARTRFPFMNRREGLLDGGVQLRPAP